MGMFSLRDVDAMLITNSLTAQKHGELQPSSLMAVQVGEIADFQTCQKVVHHIILNWVAFRVGL
jgi:hypothetical protein